MFIKVRVKTGQKKEVVLEKSNTSFSVSVKEKAERNAANHRVIAIIAERLGVPSKKVRIVNGHHAPSKLLFVAE